MKAAVGAVALFSASPLSTANADDLLSGSYIGAFAGGVYAHSDFRVPARTLRTTGDVSITVPSMQVDHLGGVGGIVGLRAGYGALYSSGVYLGIEAEFTYPLGVDVEISGGGMRYRASLDAEYAAFLRAGWSWDAKTLLFLRGGVIVPRQIIDHTSDTEKRWSPSPAVGVGVEHSLDQKYSLRLDITYSAAMETYQLATARALISFARRF